MLDHLKLLDGFVVYLASNPRPINEVLNPNRQDITSLYTNEFKGMTNRVVSLEELLAVREKLCTDIVNKLNDNQRKFLLSIKKGQPEYSLLPFSNLENFPALQWKIKNIQKLKSDKHQTLIDELKKTLGMNETP